MKLTQILYRQHIGRQVKRHWRVQGTKIAEETGAKSILEKHGKTVYEPSDILQEKREFQRIEIVQTIPKPLPLDENHPNWHKKICYTHKDSNVLLGGLNQAKVLTNTVEIQDGLPEKLVAGDVQRDLNVRVKEIVRNSHLFDAEQVKLPKIKDPLRPAFNFPRVYGITDKRVNKLIVSKLLQLIELNSELSSTRNRAIFNDLCFSYPFKKGGSRIQFELSADTLLTSSKPLGQISNKDTSSIDLPEIYPTKETITLNKENIYELRNFYPIDTNISKCHPHTLFVHYNATEIGNLFEEEVTEEQILGRTLLKAFTVGACYAKQLHGENAKQLPKPVTIQCVQTDGRLFHFGVLQINSLDLANPDVKNVWFHTSRIPLFASCRYVLGRPTLEGYNSEVLRHLVGFYNNE